MTLSDEKLGKVLDVMGSEAMTSRGLVPLLNQATRVRGRWPFWNVANVGSALGVLERRGMVEGWRCGRGWKIWRRKP